MDAVRTAVLALLAAVSVGAGVPPARAQQSLPGAGTNSLPQGSDVTAPLRRGPNGEIEVVTPELLRKSGEPICAPDALCVGEGGTYKSLAAALAVAKPGATIDLVGGTYREAAAIAVPGVTLRGIAGRPHLDCAGLAPAGGRACLLLAAKSITLETLEITGAAGACIANAPNRDFAVRDVICHDFEAGVRGDGGAALIEGSEFFENGRDGSGDGVFEGDCTLTVRGSAFRDAASGDELSAACGKIEITDTTFRSTSSAHTIEFPAGGDVLIYRSTLETRPSSGKEIIAFASKSCAHPGNLVLKQVAIANLRADAEIRNYNLCKEGEVALEGVNVTGFTVRTEGFVVDHGGNSLRPVGSGGTAQ